MRQTGNLQFGTAIDWPRDIMKWDFDFVEWEIKDRVEVRREGYGQWRPMEERQFTVGARLKR
jgi:hypothetical protein